MRTSQGQGIMLDATRRTNSNFKLLLTKDKSVQLKKSADRLQLYHLRKDSKTF